jgi:Tetracyclin repressor-like, C-terminal domain
VKEPRVMGSVQPSWAALMLAVADRDHQFKALLHERVLAPRKAGFLAVLRRAAGRGQVRPEAASQLVAEVGLAMVVQRFLVDGPPVPDDYVVSVLDEVVLPLLRP